MRELLLVASFGAIGATSRFGISTLMRQLLGSSFAYGTLVVNLLGCLLLGFAIHMIEARTSLQTELRAAIGVGLLGALTTFSTFGLETFDFLEKGRYAAASINIGANLFGGLLLVWAGVNLARYAIGP